MKVFYSKYELQPLSQLNSSSQIQNRIGALLKVEFSPHCIGYSDCLPWIELGDPDIDEQLESLKKESRHKLISRSLELAQWDGEFRANNKSIYPSHPILSSHYLLTNIDIFSVSLLNRLVDEEYSHLKIKMGRDLNLEAELLRRLTPILPEDISLRLDFNGNSNFEDMNLWLESIGQEVINRIDFIEDPFDYESNNWSILQDKWNIALALDHGLSSNLDLKGANVLIIKPSRVLSEEFNKIIENYGSKRFIFTHSMGHAVERVSSLAYAMNFYSVNPEKTEVGGFESSKLYQNSNYESEVFTDGSIQLGVDGHGVGFDQLLANENWIEL